MTLEEKLLQLRLENRYTLKSAAAKLDISEMMLRNWENGISTPTLPDLKKIATLYAVGLDYLLDHEISSRQKERMQKEKGLLHRLTHLLSKTP